MALFTKRKNSSGSEKNIMCRNSNNHRVIMASSEEFWPIPMKAIGAQNLLTLYGGVTFSGYLHKKGGTQLISKWPLRFIVIHKGCVYYFKTSSSTSPQGAFSLNGYNRVMRAAEETTSSNVFPFKMVHISKNHRTWYFSAASEDERKQWMLALRKEIDYYHEKKEAAAHLSDSSSDTDSFYGTVEQPIDIKYSPRVSEIEGDDDTDDDYEEPDSADDANASPPDYPPPAVPDTSPQAMFKDPSCRTTESPSLTPVPRRSLPGLAQDGFLPQGKGFSSAPGIRKSELGPHPTREPVPLPMTKPPPPPVPHHKKPIVKGPSTESNMPLKPVTQDKPPKSPSSKDIAKELQLKLGVMSPPPMPHGPKPSKTIDPAEPAKPQVGQSKPVLYKPTVLPKPPPPEAKPTIPPGKPKLPKPELPQIQRASPDGQSFKGVLKEKPSPTIQKRSTSTSRDDSDDDDDDDYEHAQLPDSVYVKTTESYEVERLFKATSPKGIPCDGLYCIRNSSTKSGQVLVVWDESENKIRNYRIFETSNKFYLDLEEKFTDLGSMVEFYHNHILPNHDSLRLSWPFGYTAPSR